MSETNIVTDVLDVFRAAGFEVRESRFGPTPETIIYGTADNAGVLMESVLEHFGKATEGADSCAQREKCEVKNLAHAGVTAEPEGLAQSEKPHDLTIREAFDAVGGWMNGGEMGYPSFGSFEALSIYTTKMIRCFFGNKAWHERNDAQVPAAEVRAVEQRLDEMQAIIRAGSYWNGNEQAFADKTESDVAMLDDLLSDVFRKLRSLAQQSTADKASEVRAAEWISVEDRLPEVGAWCNVLVDRELGDFFDRLNKPRYDVYAAQLRDIGSEGYASWQRWKMSDGGPMGLLTLVSHWMPLPAAPSTATSNDTGALGGKGAEA